ncbi:MAG: hemolysin III [Candidatus Azotimanducaceae bacterium]
MTAKYYSAIEESINIVSHGLGFLLGLVALAALMQVALPTNNGLLILSFGIFGLSLVVTYGASTVYHAVKEPLLRGRLRVVDHASIYLLIAGTYTPFTLITLDGPVGWSIFGVCWSMALVGVILKLFFTGRYSLLSTLMYVFMGWMIIFAISPLNDLLPPLGLRWLIAGGVLYTLGAVIYAIKRIPFNHALFHVFTLLGSASHFIAVYGYVR